MSILKTPQEIIHDLKKTMSGHEIAKHVGCSPEFINKLANGERKNPRYQKFINRILVRECADQKKAPRLGAGWWKFDSKKEVSL